MSERKYSPLMPLALAILLAALVAHPSAAQDGAATDSLQVWQPEVLPELVHFVDAEYPPSVLKAGIEGTVLLELLVTAEGQVDSVVVVESLEPALDAAAMAAATKFVFTPAMAGGEPVPVFVQFAYEFSVREQARRTAEFVNLRGRVRERGTRDPIADAVIAVSFPDSTSDASIAVPWHLHLETIGGFDGQYLEADRLVAFTDSVGVFEFKSLPSGPVRIQCPTAGYEPFVTREVLNPEELLEVELWLNPTRTNDYEIVVYGRAEHTEVTRQRLSVMEVEKLPGFGGDVIKSVQALPGVARPTVSDPGAIVIRGSGSYDTRYFLDGIDIPLLFHYGGVKSTYNSLALESVDMYPGGFGTKYGSAIGGIVELTGRSPRDDRWHFTGDVSLLDATIHAEGPLGKGWSALFSARRSYVGEILDAALRGVDDLNLTMAPYYWDTVARLEWDGGPDQQLFLTAFAAKDRLDLIFPEEDEGSREVNEATDQISMDLLFSRYILGWDRNFAHGLSNSLRASYGTNREEGHIFGYFDFESTGPSWQLRDNLAWEINDRLTPNIGIDALDVPIDYAVKVQGHRSSIVAENFADLGAYANLEWWVTDDLLVIPGVRYDHYTHLDEGEASYRLTSRWQLNDKHTLTGAIGTYNQMPEPVGQSTDPVYGNPDLPPTRATHFTLGDEIDFSDRTSLKVEAYYNTQDRIPAVTDSLDLNFVADAEARMYGLEFMLRTRASDRFFGWISYCLSRSERRYQRWPGEGMDGGEGSGGQTGAWDPNAWVLGPLDQTHHFEALGSYNIGSDWTIGARAQYVTGNPQTPLLSYDGNRYQFDADLGDYVPVYGDYLGDRMEPYVRLDLRIDKKFVRKNTIWNLYLDVQNANYFVYNSPEGYTYNYDYSKRSEYGWIILPSIGVRVEY